MSGADQFVLRETLKKAINEIQREIAHAENWKMREGLEKREENLKTILAQIPDVANISA
jgi:predicted SprT family Zn-dependent metalloprotease